MNLFNNLSSFDLDFSYLYPDSPDLAEQPYQFDSCKQQPTYQDMSVQALEYPSPVYHSQLDMHQLNDDFVNSLDKYNIDSLKQTDPADAFGTDAPDTPQSVFNGCVSGYSGNETVNDTLSSRSGFFISQQVCLPGSEPDIREPTPASHSNHDDQLTDPPVVLSNPQPFPTVTIPVDLNQTTSANKTTQTEEITDGNLQ